MSIGGLFSIIVTSIFINNIIFAKFLANYIKKFIRCYVL